MSYDYDTIIVGGGPAGTTCALYAERMGLKVLLVDKKKFPRDKICGDAISGKSIQYLQELGLDKEVEKVPHVLVYSVVFSSPNEKVINIPFASSEHEAKMYGFICRRYYFDNVLFQAAKKKVEALEGIAVEDLIIENGQVRGVKGKAEDGTEFSATAKVVVGADGFSSIVARKMGCYDHDPDHWLVATRAYYRGVKDLHDWIELHYIEDIIPGYFWIFPADDGLANVGMGMLYSKLKKKRIRLRYAHEAATRSPFFKQRFEDAELIGDIQGWNLPVGSKRRQIHGNGFLLAGDAAGLIDPFTGEGIGNAMCSGKIAAETLAEVCQGNDFSAKKLQLYPRKLWQRLGPELRMEYTLQRVGQIKPIINFVVGKAAKNADVRDWISAMMTGKISKWELVNPLNYIKLLLK